MGKKSKKNDLVKIDLSSVFGAANIFENTGAGKFSKNSKLFLCCSKFCENCIGFGIVQCFGCLTQFWTFFENVHFFGLVENRELATNPFAF